MIPEGIDIVHADDRIVVVDKPSGLLSVPGRGAETDPKKADCVKARVLARFPQATGPMTAHRLDQDTSGLMVLALDADAHRRLSVQFQEREVEKVYEALVDGHHEHLRVGDAGEIDFPILIDWPNRPRKMHDPVNGKPSRTLYRVLARQELDLDERPEGVRTVAVTRLRLEPITGRSHQLRVHCAFGREIGGLAAPIIGDTLYHPRPRGERLMLHARELSFTHPGTGERVRFEVPPTF